ncbi:MAG: tetratricopeptide repeat protein [Burkholderiaceae bacterium]|nr:tetratricopeptide repeat protein [Burkholderiaceae bacterium]
MALSTSDGDGEAPLYRYRFGNAEFDEARAELRVAGLVVEIEPRPLQVLGELLRHPGEVVTKEELFERVWEGRPTVENVLPNAVAKLRKLLQPADAARIVTVPRRGLRLDGPVERSAAGRRLHSRLSLQPQAEVPGREAFHLERQLGLSHTGEVWLARHQKTRQPRVFKFAGDGERLAALKREATLWRLLRESLGERDDLVRVIDWNFDTPPFFLECEYDGQDLKTWATENGQLAALSLPDRLGLFRQIAGAVAAAHGVGVLHKDLKPANVMVAPRPDGSGDGSGHSAWQLRLGDFGSARLMRPETLAELDITALGLTSTQALAADTGAGTPMYLAPELLAGQAPSVRSDVYALGLLLYQLAVADLQRPMAPGWEQDITDELLREDIAAAAAGQPTRRLDSAAALLERLEQQPARREARLRERAREARLAAAEAEMHRARARRPWIVGAGLALSAGLAAALIMVQQVRQARDAAQAQAALAAEMHRFIDHDLLGGGRGSAITYERNPTLRELLDTAQLRLQGRFEQTPQIEAGLRSTLGVAYRTLGDFAAAEGQLRRATELNRLRLAPDDKTRLLAEYDLVGVLVRLSKFDEARARLDEADQLGQALRDDGGELALRAQLARGAFHFQRLEVEPASAAYSAAESLQRSLRPDDLPLQAHIRLTLADAQLRMGNAARAEGIARDLLAGEPYTEASVGMSLLASARRLLGNALRNQGRPAEGIPHLERSVAEQERARGPDDQATIAALSSLGYLYSLTGDEARRARIQREVYARSLRRWGAQHQYTLVEQINLGEAELDIGQYEAARAHLQSAVEGLLSTAGPQSRLVDVARFSYAGALHAVGRHREALAETDSIDAAKLAGASADAQGDGKLAALRGRVLHALGRIDEAQPVLERAIALLQQQGEDEAAIAPLRGLLTALPRRVR